MATKAEITNEFSAVVDYMQPNMTDRQMSATLKVWIEDLEMYPLDTIRGAIKEYRRAGNKFIPRASEIAKLCADKVDPYKPLQDTLDELYWLEAGGVNCDNEYSRLVKHYVNMGLEHTAETIQYKWNNA